MKIRKKKLIEWGIIIMVISILYFTGLHREVIGRLQQGILVTGLIQPDVIDNNDRDKELLTGELILEAADGKRVSLSDMQNKVLFINFWATWCPLCIAEMPGINDLYNETVDDEMVFLMISTDKEFNKAKDFVSRKGFDFPIYRLRSSIPFALQSRVLPSTYIVAKDGEIVVKHQGMADYNNNKMKDLLKKLSDETN